MIRAIKAVSSERGRDVRDYALFAFGGNGPLFAAVLAEALQMKRIVVPPSPGVFSSFGLLYSEIEHHFSRTFWRVLRETDPNLLSRELDRMKADALESLKRQGFSKRQTKVLCSASLRYKGQSFELTIPIKGDRINRNTYAHLEEAFGQEHERTYGHRAGPDEPVEIVTLLVVGRGVPDKPRVPNAIRINRAEAKSKTKRRAYFGPSHGWREVSVLTRSDLKTKKKGPFIVEEYDATCIVPIGASASLDRFGNIVMDLNSSKR
jgi:N-methylhydantoinase A